MEVMPTAQPWRPRSLTRSVASHRPVRRGQPLKLLIRAKPYNATIAAPNNPMDVSWRAMTMWFGTLVVTQLKNSVKCVAGSVLDRSSMTMAGGLRDAL